MASPYKIPKKKQPEDGVSDSLEMQSPLSRLADGPGSLKKSWEQSSRSRADRMHAGIGLGSRAERDGMPRQPLFSGVVVKTLLGFDRPIKVGPIMSAANRRPGGILGPYPANHRADYLAKSTWNNQSCSGTPTRRPGQKPAESTSCVPNGWRPKRASDRLFQETVPAKWESVSSPEEKRHSSSSSSSPEFSDSVLCVKSSSVELVDSHLPAQEDAGSSRSTSLGQKTQRPGRNTTKRDGSERESSPEAVPNLLKKNPSSGTTRIIWDWTSDEDFNLPCRTSPDKKVPLDSQKHSSSSVLMTSNRFTLNRTTPWVSASKNLSDEQKEQERDRWRGGGSPLSLHLKPRRTKQTPAEPIVLSSEEEEGEADEGDGEQSSRMEVSHLQPPGDVQSCPGERAGSRVSVGPTPSFMELEFSSLHAGLVHANASSSMMISERGINFPLTDSQALGGEVEFVTVVASEVRGYGVWDGGMVQDGTLLADWEGPAPSLLFLWLTDAQANLIMAQLPTTHPGPSCAFLLLVLKEQLVGLQAALLASMLDMEEFRRGRSSSLRSPLDWTDGLLLLHSAPPPLDQHFLSLLGHTVDRQEEKPSHAKTRGRKSLVQPAMLQSLSLPSRLIQYPAAPCKGRIAVTKEDLACLDSGEFLNDVIIDFYLKYLLLEGVGGAVAERCHIFSSFFFKQLSRRRTAGEDDAPFVPDRHTRHQRVKTWTRHVDIFTKDFLFVPVNQEAHWYLVVICFPGLEESLYEVWKGPAMGEDSGMTSGLQSQADQRPRSSGGLSSVSQPSAGGTDQASHLLPGCTQQGWQGEMVLKRPCILVMDSLKLSHHENVCQLLRGYLHVEWGVRRGTPRLFTPDTMKSSNCRVPLQDNSSDCGLYLLQYVESFMTNPAVHYQLPLRLEHWFPRQQVWRKREEIRSLVMKMHQSQQKEEDKRP